MSTTQQSEKYIKAVIEAANNDDRDAALEMIDLLLGQLHQNILNIQPDIYSYFVPRLEALVEDKTSPTELLNLTMKRGRPADPSTLEWKKTVAAFDIMTRRKNPNNPATENDQAVIQFAQDRLFKSIDDARLRGIRKNFKPMEGMDDRLIEFLAIPVGQ